MGKSCEVCKKPFRKGLQRSFFCFPNNVEERRLWFSCLSITCPEDKMLKKYVYICSDHFEGTDFVTKPYGKENTRTHLKKGSKPKIINFDGPSTSGIQPLRAQHILKTQQRSSYGTALLETYITDAVRSSSTSAITSSQFEIESEKRIPQIKCISDTTHFQTYVTDIVKSSSSSSTLTASEVGTSPRKRKQNFDTTLEAVQSGSNLRKKFEIGITGPARKKNKLLRYTGDIQSDDFFSSLTRAKKSWHIVRKKKQQIEIKLLQKSNRRLKDKVICLNSLLTYLKENNLITEIAQETLSESLPDSAKELFTRILKGPCKQKYNPCLRSFVMTLQFYSPKAYRYVRKKFNNSLPHPSIITKWYQSVDGSPGFTKEALEALKIKVVEAKKQNKTILCNLVMDEIAIRKEVEWNGKKLCGYIDIGSQLSSDSLPEATEALVFMLVSLNQHWKIPVGYFLINGLSGLEKANLLKQMLQFVHESGVVVTSVTFDGAASNILMAQSLGADFYKPDHLNTFFNHPITNEKVFFFLDPSHILKLVRNCLESYKIMTNTQSQEIHWRYLDTLVHLQAFEGVKTMSIKGKHLEWARDKMRVKPTAQTLSKSVSDALSHLRKDLHLENFKGTEATEEFLLIFNDLFDIFNSRNRFANYFYKRPFSPKTEQLLFSRMEEAKHYILNLKYGTQNILKTGQKTGLPYMHRKLKTIV